ncbi:MAG: hypothetical protein ACOVRB_06720 [Akkermansiaceae bacterium]
MLFLLWNGLPYYSLEYDPTTEQEKWIRSGWILTEIWPDIVRDVYHNLQTTPNFEDCLSAMATLALFFLAAIQFLLAPLWQTISSSRLLRFIPMGLCILGFLVVAYFVIDDFKVRVSASDYFQLFILGLIGLNFFLSASALLFYHPETNPRS